MLPAACRSTPPVVKIGLMAPFEGLYRRSGYEALAALRAALADVPPSDLAVLPLALDDHALPDVAERTAAKLLVDPGVQAVIGPLSPALTARAAPAMSRRSLFWAAPYAVEPDGEFAGPATADGWANELLVAVAEAAARQGAQRLALAGWTPGWPRYPAHEWERRLGLPALLLEDADSGGLDAAAAQVTATDAVIWLGAPDTGAAFLRAVRQTQPDAPFWLVGLQGGDPVFAERAGGIRQVFWAVWSDGGYHAWSATHAQATPNAYLTYRAAASALAHLTGAPTAVESRWEVLLFRLAVDGAPQPWTPSSGNTS
jgi:branched-chain amino acid transport system substrate-binding protein